ncbi:hypothetical protein [Dysgonomonas sp. 25]|uniref:hypothetical protein n=1 Tax=Dysgonomonas sp. 25 TaxID=2302933 RepID=UPI0013D7D46D|nr:hypothetical protein [Dysgonomonas sp. 25]NDV67514.1 hypothetical protein [Dysgonomonas sp. 25]
MKLIRFHIIAIFILLSVLQAQSLKGAEAYANDTIQPPILMTENAIEAKDTIRSKKLPESYQTLKEQSAKKSWTKSLFRLIVREPKVSFDAEENKSIAKDYEPFRDKIIRNIEVTVLAPFGTDVRNPDKVDEDAEIFNKTHVLSRESTIKKHIQFRRGDRVNPAIIAASEVELRDATYINDARIVLEPVTGNDEMVDVRIIARDKWTIGVDIHNLSSSRMNIEVFDKNIAGTGSRMGANFIYTPKYSHKVGFGANYLYENIANTKIDGEISYVDEIKMHEFSASLTRKLQPRYNYFGEISYKNNVRRPEYINWDSITPDRRELFSATIGRAFTLSEDNSIKRIVVGFRYKHKMDEYRNEAYQDYIKTIMLPYKHARNRIWLMQLSLFKNSYQRDYLVYNFGTTENIALGYNLSMQLGYSRFYNLDVKDGMYGSFSASYGSNDLTKGTLYLYSAISSFWDKKKPFESVFKFNMHYFTPLMRLYTVRVRQFLNLSYGKLMTPDRYFGDRIYMGEHTSLKMKNWRRDRKGVEQLLFKAETDMFSNYELLGFRCLFYSFFDLGWIREEGSLFKNENLNYGIGLGIRLRNDFIIFNTIDLKIGVYPKLEQSGFRSFFKVRSSSPRISTDFTPDIPEEILLEY